MAKFVNGKNSQKWNGKQQTIFSKFGNSICWQPYQFSTRKGRTANGSDKEKKLY
jgi:hypothetical protein